MTVGDVAKQTGVAAAEVRVIASRPERIEQLDWRIRWAPPSSEVATSNPLSEILFSFYNNELFVIEISYDRDKTAGLTENDMVEAISAVYGSATKLVAGEIDFNSGANTTAKAIARWEDAQSQLNLVYLPYEAGFGLSLALRSIKMKADRAIVESARLDVADAPRREAALRDKQSADARAADEKARLVNKPGFRP